MSSSSSSSSHHHHHDQKETTPGLATLPPNSVTLISTAPVNIAVIKYWGKRDESLILPINSSLSGTIDSDCMCAKTQIIASKSILTDSISLNHKEEKIESNKRMIAVIQNLRERAGDYKDETTGKILISSAEWKDYHFRIISVNNFPTAAGLASSAAGYACFTYCLANLLGVKEKYEGELSSIARQGSGSACRSLYGGFVKWEMGEKKSGEDSIAVQVKSENHWDEMRVIILVANEAKKDTSSTDGMQRSVVTSPLLAYRASHIVPQRMKDMELSIENKDFQSFGRLTMMDSNQFHATCLDTYPPIFYLNETSKHIISVVDHINAYYGKIVAAYTFDAGPNGVIYCLNAHAEQLLNIFLSVYRGGSKPSDFIHDPTKISVQSTWSEYKVWNDESEKCLVSVPKPKDGQHVKIHQIIMTKVGGGPKVVGKSHTFETK